MQKRMKMPDNKPIVISKIPAYASLPNGVQMQRGMRMLDRAADRGVGKVPDGKFTKANFEYFRSKSNSYLRKHAIFALGLKKFSSFIAFKKFVRKLIANSKAKPANHIVAQLLRVAQMSRDPVKRWEAMTNLGDNFYWHPKVVKFALGLLRLTRTQARKHAATMYGSVRVAFILAFKPSLLADGMIRLKAAALKALGLGGDARQVRQIAPFLKHKDKRLRRAALKALRRIYAKHRTSAGNLSIRDPDPAPLTTVLIKDRNVATRKDAVRLLGMMTNVKTESVRLSALIAALNDSDAAVVVLAMEALASIGRKWTIPYIKPFLKDRRAGVRAKARECIGRFKVTSRRNGVRR